MGADMSPMLSCAQQLSLWMCRKVALSPPIARLGATPPPQLLSKSSWTGGVVILSADRASPPTLGARQPNRVSQSIPLDDSEIFVCKIRKVLISEELTDAASSLEQRIQGIAPVSSTCRSYFSWDGRLFGAWGEPMKALRK